VDLWRTSFNVLKGSLIACLLHITLVLKFNCCCCVCCLFTVSLIALSQRKLQGVDLWRTSFNVLKGSLIACLLHITSFWERTCCCCLCCLSTVSLIALPQRKLQGVDLWRTSFNVLKGSLIVAGQLLNAWASEACTLSSDWAVGVDAGDHMWEGPACADSYLAAFQERLEQVRHVSTEGKQHICRQRIVKQSILLSAVVSCL
jgi:hypothetical protein